MPQFRQKFVLVLEIGARRKFFEIKLSFTGNFSPFWGITG
jgi:hypothetical protein